jgi:hypothetical protein
MATIAFNYESDARADIYIENFADLLQTSLLVIRQPGQEPTR